MADKTYNNFQRPQLKHRLGGWMPKDSKHTRKWLGDLVHKVRARPKAAWSPAILAFQELIEGDTQVYMYFHMMFEQVPLKPPYNEDPTGNRQIRNYIEMLDVFNYLLTQGPLWIYNTEGQMGLIGFPFNAVLDWPMGTPSGVSAFLRTDVNECFRNMLNEYKIYLESPESQAVLNTGAEGWFSEQALSVMGSVASQGYGPITFEEAYICAPAQPAYGYISWDDFFIRKFREGVRPIASPGDSKVINNACESGPYALVTNVQKRDRFWIKGQPYSLLDILNFDGKTDYFVGGTLYQAFLSALSYHCWHSPIDGTVVKIVHVPGAYYAENYWEGFANIDPITGEPDPDPAAPNNSQGYICEIAARAIIYIEANDPNIGIVCIVEVGMAEVSSCEVIVTEGQPVRKGDLIGMFHFGGSTHCLIFRPGLNLDFVRKPPFSDDSNIPVMGKLATILP